MCTMADEDDVKVGDVCPHCKKGKLEISKYDKFGITDGPDHLACPECDSTYYIGM